MTIEELDRYHELLAQGKTHWEALGIIFNVTDP